MAAVLSQNGDVVYSQFVHFGYEMGVELIRAKLNSSACSGCEQGKADRTSIH